MTRKRLLRIGVYGTLGAIVLVLALHPYTRQLAIGPKMRGEPLCTWQQSFRHRCDPDEGTDSFVASVLTWIGSRSLPPEPWPGNEPDMLPVVLSLAHDPNPLVRKGVAESLADYPLTPETLGVAIELAHDQGPKVREEIAVSLARHPLTSDPGDVLTGLLDDASPDVRVAAMTALTVLWREAHHAPALPKLQKLMADEDPRCRVSAAAMVLEAAGKAQDDKALAIMLQELRDPRPMNRFNAAHVLTALHGEHSEYLEHLLAAGRTDPVSRCGYASALWRLGKPGVPLLATLLEDDDATVRRQAALGFRSVGMDGKAAMPALVGALADPDPHVREIVGQVLSYLDPKRYPEGKARH